MKINSAEEIRDEMLQFLSAKYDREFIAISLDQRGIGNSNDVLRCYAVGDDPDSDYFNVVRSGRGNNMEYADKYFGIMIREEIESEIGDFCRSLALNSKVYSSPSHYYDNKYDSTKSFADLKKDTKVGAQALIVHIGILNEHNVDMESTSGQLFQILAEEGFEGSFSVCFMTEEGYSILNRGNSLGKLKPGDEHVLARYYKLI